MHNGYFRVKSRTLHDEYILTHLDDFYLYGISFGMCFLGFIRKIGDH